MGHVERFTRLLLSTFMGAAALFEPRVRQPRFSPVTPATLGVQKMPGKVQLSEAQRMTYGQLPLGQQYATLCALGDRSNYEQRYERGLIDFTKHIAIPGVEEIGINWEYLSLLVGTECVDVECGNDLHELGQYVIAYTQNPAGYAITNITWVVKGGGEEPIGHPHAHQGAEFCMSSGNGMVKAGHHRRKVFGCHEGPTNRTLDATGNRYPP